MLATDDERSEVARRLRGLRMTAPGVTSVGHGYLWSLLWAVFGDEMGELDRSGLLERMCSRLADLIEPGEPKVKCVAEVKIDGERLEKLVHDAAVELAGIDRDALLALADEIEDYADGDGARFGRVIDRDRAKGYSRRIREALGVER